MTRPGEALVIAGHGSHLNPDSDRPVFEHAAAIRSLEVFDEVREAFWKEEPALGEVLRMLEHGTVYVVPLFMSDGYFTDRVIPRELRLTGQRSLTDDKEVHYSEPVGTHESMANVIVQRAMAVSGNADIGDGVGLAIVGHGTTRHETSGRSTHDHAARIRAMDRFDEVHALFMDEEPFVDRYLEIFSSPAIVVVPFFVADGYHTREDLPEMLGLPTGEPPVNNQPLEVVTRRVWYAGAVGTAPRVSDVIIERAVEVGATPRSSASPEGRWDTRTGLGVAHEPSSRHRVSALIHAAATGVSFDGLEVSLTADRFSVATPRTEHTDLTESRFRETVAEIPAYVSNWYYWTYGVDVSQPRFDFLRWIERADGWPVEERYDRLENGGIDRNWGQLHISTEVNGDGTRRYTIRHEADEDAVRSSLERHRQPADARELAKYDERGAYRPLKTVPNLQTGWIFPELSAKELLRTVDYFYPASVANWHLERVGRLDIGHWRPTAARQTGIYDLVEDLPDAAVERAVWACCRDSHCLKRRRWELDEENEFAVPSGEGEFPCREPCSLFIAGAREWTVLERGSPIGNRAEETDRARADLENVPDDRSEESVSLARAGEFSDPENPYRRRYLRARRADDDEGCDPARNEENDPD